MRDHLMMQILSNNRNDSTDAAWATWNQDVADAYDAFFANGQSLNGGPGRA